MSGHSRFRAGDLTLDLVNTVAWRLDPARRDDRLTTGSTLASWVGATELADLAAVRTHLADPDWWTPAVPPVVRLREQLYRVLAPLASGRTPATRDLDQLRKALSRTISRAELTTLIPPEWTVQMRQPADVADLIVVHVLRFCRTADPDRLRQCADEVCGWLFIDNSRNGNRRWCSSADCGNRNRVLRHRRGQAPRNDLATDNAGAEDSPLRTSTAKARSPR